MSNRSKLHLPGGIRRPGRVVLVRNWHGNPLLCNWDDCDKLGNDVIHVDVRTGGVERPTRYIFCSDRHLEMFVDQSRPKPPEE
jgi:hypothetical protein